ncbi:MAG: TonB-dependent receptor [Ignavibacteriaceae bacterium]
MVTISPVKVLIITLLIAVSVNALGNLRGVVTDSLTGEELVGANIFLPGTSLGSATNFEGRYNIPGIPAGNYTVKISYIGYRAKETNVTIVEGRTLQLDVQILPDILEGEEVLVTAQAAGQMAAINQQRSSNTIINVISEEKIKELPDANAAESIGRLPGVSILRSGGEANKVILRGLEDKFTTITIDGIKIPPTDATGRGVDLSMLSQSSLAGIELYKAITPDKDGDALAGSVNLVTKAAPEQRRVRADLKGSYNDLESSFGQYDFSLNYGERFFDNILGVQVNGNIERKVRSNERINVDYTQNQRYLGDYFIDDFLLEYTDELRKRNGVSVLLDINTPDEGTIRINTVYGGTNRDYLWSTRDYPTRGGGSSNGETVYNYRDREQEINTFNSSVRGDNHLLGLTLNWGLSFAQSESEFPYDYELIFTEPNGMRPTGDIYYREKPEDLIQYAVNNYSNAALNWAYYRNQDNFDKEKTAFLNISKDYTLSNMFSGQIKVGGKYRVKDRYNSRSEDFAPYYLGGTWKTHERLPDGTVRPKDFSGTAFEDWWRAGGGTPVIALFLPGNLESREIYDSYSLTPLLDRDRLRLWGELNSSGVDVTGNNAEVWGNPLIRYDDYNVTERVSAGYLMNTLNIGQNLTIIAGLRFEYEDNDYLAYYMTTRAQGFPVSATFRDTTSSSNQTVWLPNVNISFRPNDFMNIRLAAYKALARPDFNMRMDRLIAGRGAESTSSFVLYTGNPNLKTAEAWNFEINTSFYGNEIGLISLSAYYKEIKDMYHMLNNFVSTAVMHEGVIQDTLMRRFGIMWPNLMGSTPYNLTFPYNSPKPTKVWGFEFEHQINFHFLPGLLKNIVLSYNASIVRSETIIYGSETISFIDSTGIIPRIRYTNILVERKQKLEGMPEFFGNISLGYDIAGFSARISLFHKGKHNVSFSAAGRSDQETIEFTRLDLAFKQKVTDYLSLFLNINNLTDVEDGTSQLNREFNRTLFNQSEKYGLTADFGVTLQL